MNKLFEVKGVQGMFCVNADKVVACAPNCTNDETNGMTNVWFGEGDPWLLDVPYVDFVHLWKQTLERTE